MESVIDLIDSRYECVTPVYQINPYEELQFAPDQLELLNDIDEYIEENHYNTPELDNFVLDTLNKTQNPVQVYPQYRHEINRQENIPQQRQIQVVYPQYRNETHQQNPSSAQPPFSELKPTKTKRKRTTVTAHQLLTLEEYFKKYQKLLPKSIKIFLSKELGMTEDQIKIWFQNKRSRLRAAALKKKKISENVFVEEVVNLTNFVTKNTDIIEKFVKPDIDSVKNDLKEFFIF